ncbi:enoyl-CoA hydratase/carnithine racemase [Brevibacillus panacihumi W25]|uniref:Enoyl-CoA hydratase/carnithine racemase n=1 Tax=Brevibacillus panacihumi W25 TaxID=1408254 RepID=V6MBH6_9BACL|nr:enoyl-CoA hydratase-related protein [Brevibacillus panacihumi]EST52713.1 enoyl-CoA hydratase/carnithine racemase [Brevibacillus panacihumi W25]
MEDQEKQILVDKRDGVWTITLNRPQVLNALTVEMFGLLRDVIVEASEEEEAHFIVLKGAGGNFCSGADLSVLGSLKEERQAHEALTVINDLLTRLHQMPKPVIAAIDGVAVGAGLNLALHADFVLAAKSARLQEPFVQIGLTTDFGGTYLLPRLVGLAQAKRLALLADPISGEEAEQIGLIYKAVPADLLGQEVENLLRRLRQLPKKAYSVTKEGLNQSLQHDLGHMLAWEKEQQPALLQHPEFAALIRAKMKR